MLTNEAEKITNEVFVVLPEEWQGIAVKVEQYRVSDGHHLTVVDLSGSNLIYHPKLSLEEDGMPKPLLISRTEGYDCLSFEEIRWGEACSSYCLLHTVTRGDILVSFPLACVEGVLPKNRFLRIQRSYIVNLNYVDRLKGNTVVLGQDILTIGREYKKQVMERFSLIGSGMRKLKKDRRNRNKPGKEP